MLKRKPEETSLCNKQELMMGGVQAWQGLTREDTQHLLMSMGHRLQEVIACKIQSMTTHLHNMKKSQTLFSTLKLVL
uniref:Uncharacterized protein n=1 Tax=Anguilla anguilla TaxID=7936 RepID=A0A0E9P8B2_ANGAN